MLTITRQGLGRALIRPLPLAMLWLVVALYGWSLAKALKQGDRRIDFSVYYLSALTARQGLDPYRANFGALAKQFHFNIKGIAHATDPPTFVVCIEPLSLMGPRAAYWLWMGINAAMLAAALFLLFGPQTGLGAGVALALAAFAILYPPVADHFFYAQSKIPILLALVLMARWMEAGYDAAAGLMLALAGLLRLFPMLLLVYLVLRRRWQMLVYTAIWVAVGAIATVAVLGLASSLDFLRALTILTEQRPALFANNVAISAAVSRLFWAIFGVKPSGGLDAARVAAGLLAQAAVFALTVWATVGASGGSRKAGSGKGAGEDRLRAELSLWIIAAVVLSPIAWTYDLVLVLFLFSALAQASVRSPVDSRAVWAAVLSFMARPSIAGPQAALWWIAWKIPALQTFFHYGALLALAAAYLSAFWFVRDRMAFPPSREAPLLAGNAAASAGC